MRALLLDDSTLVRAVAAGRRRRSVPPWRRVEVRYVDIKAGRCLQVTAYDATQAHSSNAIVGPEAAAAVDALLAEPFGNWHVETTSQTLQLRVTKRLEALVHAKSHDQGSPEQDARPHDRAKARLLPEDDPVLRALGISDERGRIKPSRQAKYRQVEEFLRLLGPALDDAVESGRLRRASNEQPLHVADLGCGNAYLTFAAFEYLTAVKHLPVRMTGVDSKAQSLEHNTALADQLGIDSAAMTFRQGDIGLVELDPPPDVVLALHACDTATDDALARAVQWGSSLVLAAPCCHHDIAAQLLTTPAPAPYSLLTRSGILRERFADTLTDALRAEVLRSRGYRVDVVEFVGSEHTPRNTMLRAVRQASTAALAEPNVTPELDDLLDAWDVQPRLAVLLAMRDG